MEGSKRLRLGYVGVDVLHNATICNEADGLLEAGVDMAIASVERLDSPLFHQSGSVRRISEKLVSLKPLGTVATVGRFLVAPFVFGSGFFKAVANAFTCPAEGRRQRLTLIWHLAPALKLAFLWRKEGIGHIHAHWAHTATTVAMHTADMLKIGFSFTGHANDLFVHRVGLVGKVRKALFVVCISEFHRDFYERLGGERRRLPVVYCGIDVSRMPERESPPKGAARRRIVSVGRLVEKKGFHDLIAACGILKCRGVDFECVIAGSGPEEGRLRSLIADGKLENEVRVTGKTVLQEELADLLFEAGVFALPCVKDRDGDMDGLPQVLIEAMACGLPSVSTRLVGIPDLIRDHATGYLVDPGDVQALADRLQRMLENPSDATVVGRRGARWVRRHFTRNEAIARLKALFSAALAEPGRKPPTPILDGAPELPLEADTATVERNEMEKASV